jgi:hypothetical protein
MTAAYRIGYGVGRRRWSAAHCPYSGQADASMAMQLDWMRGWFDGSTKRKRGRPRKPRPVYYRRRNRKRWPRSAYARRRVMELLNHD